MMTITLLSLDLVAGGIGLPLLSEPGVLMVPRLAYLNPRPSEGVSSETRCGSEWASLRKRKR